MINRKIKVTSFLSLALTFGLMSCEGIGGESIYDLDKSGEIEEIKKEIIAKVGDVPVFEISLSSKEELETSLDDVTIVTNDKAADETLNRKNFQLTVDSEPTVSIIDSDFSVRVYKKNEPKQISEIDFLLIEKNFEAAKKQIPSEFSDYALYEYTIKFDDNKRSDKFTINTIMESENNHVEGNNLVTNYYEFVFEIDENGDLVMEVE